tara:strand:+ start:169 stop:1047 length:879 start_codon:yes stop_codon:yes gene_type:complete
MITESLEASKNNFIFTAETTPSVSTNLNESVEKISNLIGVADAVNITDAPNCKTKLSSLVVAGEINKSGLDVILQITGRDRNQIALESEILGALSLDINKILCLSGDRPSEDGPMAVNEMNSSDLINLLKLMSKGNLSDGTEIKDPIQLISGCADSIHDHFARDKHSNFFVEKVNMGVSFVQTQYCYDIDLCKKYSQFIQENNLSGSTKFIIGLGPLKSAKQASWMRDNLYGVKIPDSIINRLDQSTSPLDEGKKICEEIIKELMDLDGISGVHLMGPNCEDQCADLIKIFR